MRNERDRWDSLGHIIFPNSHTNPKLWQDVTSDEVTPFNICLGPYPGEFVPSRDLDQIEKILTEMQYDFVRYQDPDKIEANNRKPGRPNRSSQITYDANGRTVQIDNFKAETLITSKTYQYDAYGRLTEAKTNKHEGDLSYVITQTYTYQDEFGHPQAYIETITYEENSTKNTNKAA